MDVKGAILVELAFMTNKREATELMANEVYWKESAVEIARGLCEYTGIKYIPEKDDYVPTAPINQKSNAKDIKWLQEKLNKVNKNYQIPATGVFEQKTRIALIMFADEKGWNWGNTWGYTARQATVNSLAKFK